jgi:hypothetical protein
MYIVLAAHVMYIVLAAHVMYIVLAAVIVRVGHSWHNAPG